MTGEIYRHRQRAGLILALVVIAVIGVVLGISLVGAHLITWLAVAVLPIVAILFSSMTVRVGDDGLHWHFGPGFWKKSLPLSDIAAVRSVRNKWWYGWGIRLTPHGWMYNVSGLDAIELDLREGKKFRIGTDEPEKLLTAIRSATGRHR